MYRTILLVLTLANTHPAVPVGLKINQFVHHHNTKLVEACAKFDQSIRNYSQILSERETTYNVDPTIRYREIVKLRVSHEDVLKAHREVCKEYKKSYEMLVGLGKHLRKLPH